MTMTAVDLDPVFVKALKFLHSKAKDSGAQLKALLDDAIAQRKGLKVPVQSGDGGKSSPGRSKSDDDSNKKETEKRSSDKNKDSSEPEVKKIKLDSKSRSKDEKDARDKEKEKERIKREKEKREKEEREAQKIKEKAEKERKEKELANSKALAEATVVVSDEEEQTSQMDAGDFALEMGIACVVCRQFDVSSGNQLVECQECHSLYHQECHKPPVTEEDVSDPRFVWYCFRCTRSLKKMVTQKSSKPKTAAPPSNVGKESSIAPSKSTKTDTNSKSVSQAFRRIDPKTIVASTDATNLISTSSKPMVGLAGLAANLHKPKGESKIGSSSRKGEQKGEGIKSLSKLEIKSTNGGNKSDSSSKPSSSGNKSDGSTKFSSGWNKSDDSSKPSSGGNKSDSSSKPSSVGNKSDGLPKSSSAGNKSDGLPKSSSIGNKSDGLPKSSSGGNKSDSLPKLSGGVNKSDSSTKVGGSSKSDSSSKINSAGNKPDITTKLSSGSNKSDNSSTISEEMTFDIFRSSSKEEKDREKKLDLGNKFNIKVNEKKITDVPLKSPSSSSSSSSPSSSGREEKKTEKKLEPGKSPINSESSKLEVTSPKMSPQTSLPTTPTTPDSPSPSKFSSSTSNKQAVANLSLVTANKRIQMMKKKAQTKPGADKKLHIK